MNFRTFLYIAAFSLFPNFVCAEPPPIKNGNYTEVFVITHKAPIYRLASGNDVATTRPFGTHCAVYRQEGSRLLIGSPEDPQKTGPYSVWQQLGWIDEVNVRNTEKKGFMPLATEDGIYLKALPKNDYKTRAGSEIIDPVPIYGGPSNKYDRIGEAKLFQIYFIYDQNDKYFLLGTNERLNHFGDQDVLIGWAPKDRCFLWNTRFGLNFNKLTWGKREPAKFFNSQNSLEKFYFEKKYIEDDVVMEESDIPLSPADMRYPILPSTLRLRDSRREAFIVGVPGEVFVGNNQAFTATQAATTDQHLSRLQSDTEFVDILFIMDNTTSMSSSYSEAANAVQSFILNINKTMADRIQFALATYRDYPDGDKVLQMVTKINQNNFKGSNINELIKGLDSSCNSIRSNPNDHDLQEAVMYGIKEGVDSDKVGWRKQSSRFVILIGDHGGRPNDRGRRGDAQLSDKRGNATQLVLNTLMKNRVNLYIIHVKRGENQSRNLLKAERDFEQQTKDLVSRYDFPAIYESVDDRKDLSLHREISNLLETDVRQYIQQARSFYECIRKNGSARACRGTLNAAETANKANSAKANQFNVNNSDRSSVRYAEKQLALLSQKLTDAHLTESQLRTLAKGLQLSSEGYVVTRDNNGNEIFQPEVLLSRDELDRLSEVSRQVIEHHENRKDITSKFPRLIQESISLVTGDSYNEKESLGSFMKRSLGLPVRSPLLKRPVSEISLECQQQSDACRNLSKSIKMFRELAVLMTANRAYAENNGVIKQGTGTVDYWRILAGREFVWIPFKYLP